MDPRWLCVTPLTFFLLACGGETEKPCAPADAMAKRCQAKPAEPFRLEPGQRLPEWAENLCNDWRRSDGSCDLMQLIGDYQECAEQHGRPAQQTMFEQGVGSRTVQKAFEQATFLCLELRRWFMTDAASDAWMDRPQRAPAAPAPPS